MYISLNGTLVTGANLSWQQFVTLAANTGFGGVDVNITGAMEMGLKATQKLLAKTQLKTRRSRPAGELPRGRGQSSKPT